LVEYIIELAFRKKTGFISLDDVKNIIVRIGGNSDGVINQKLILVTNKNKIPLSLTSDNTTDTMR